MLLSSDSWNKYPVESTLSGDSSCSWVAEPHLHYVSRQPLAKLLNCQHHRCHTYRGHATWTIPCGAVHPGLCFLSNESCVFCESSITFLFQLAASSSCFKTKTSLELSGHACCTAGQGFVVETFMLWPKSDQDVMTSFQPITKTWTRTPDMEALLSHLRKTIHLSAANADGMKDLHPANAHQCASLLLSCSW